MRVYIAYHDEVGVVRVFDKETKAQEYIKEMCTCCLPKHYIIEECTKYPSKSVLDPKHDESKMFYFGKEVE